MINVGDIVLIKKMNIKGSVIQVSQNEIYVVESDTFKFHVKKQELEKLNEKLVKPERNQRLFKTTDPFKAHLTPLEIDLHGYPLKEAKKAVEEILKKAQIDKVTSVHIIHGKGSGVLRQGIQDLLKNYKSRRIISVYHYAENHDGSYGKTIIHL